MTMTKDDMNSFQRNVAQIDSILTAPDAFSAERLMQRYEAEGDKTAFVAALIGKVLFYHYRYGAHR